MTRILDREDAVKLVASFPDTPAARRALQGLRSEVFEAKVALSQTNRKIEAVLWGVSADSSSTPSST